MPTSTQIKYTCGCGFQTFKIEEALEHSEKTSHTIQALGLIRKEVK